MKCKQFRYDEAYHALTCTGFHLFALYGPQIQRLPLAHVGMGARVRVSLGNQYTEYGYATMAKYALSPLVGNLRKGNTHHKIESKAACTSITP